MDEDISLLSTVVDLAPTKFIWSIQNFRDTFRISKSLTSQHFPIAPNCTECRLYFTLYRARGKNYWQIAFEICCDKIKTGWDDHIFRHGLEYDSHTFYILGSDGQKMLGHKESSLVPGSSRCKFKISDKHLKSDSKGILRNGSLQFHFEVMFVKTPSEFLYGPKHFDSHVKTWFFLDPNDLTSLSDFKIISGDKTFSVHKLILAMRSPVFRKMFDTGVDETQENLLDLGHIDENVVKLFVEYMYSSVLAMSTIKSHYDYREIMELYKLADQFQMSCLKYVCEKKLISQLSIEDVETISDTLKLAHTQEIDDLRIAVLNFVKMNRSAFGDRVYLDKLMKDEPSLVDEILRALI